MKRISVFLTVLCGISLPAAPAQAFDQSANWQLAKLVPADSVVYVHGVHNPERDFLSKHWSHVWEALKSSGIDQDIKALISAEQETEEREK